MKLRMCIKDPNIEHQLTNFVAKEYLKDYQADNIVSDYFEYGEFLNLEIDTETLEIKLLTNFEAA
jgi:hypothetical protein